MTSPSALERAALADALADAGPAAPTLCDGWTTRDLAAHLVARERRPDSAPGLVFRPLAGWTERVRRSVARRPFEELVSLVRGGPPRTSPFALPGVDAAANLSEHVVHCEDVRRARPGWAPRELPAAVQDACWHALIQRGRILFRASPVGVDLVTADGRRHTAVARPDPVVLRGEPVELMLWAFGRGAQARVEVEGPQASVQALREVRLAV